MTPLGGDFLGRIRGYGPERDKSRGHLSFQWGAHASGGGASAASFSSVA